MSGRREFRHFRSAWRLSGEHGQKMFALLELLAQ